MARLAWDGETGRIEFQEESVSPLEEDEEALERASAWDGFAVAYNVRSIRAVLYLHFWREGDVTGVAVEIDSQIPYLRPRGMAEGEWLERFLCDYIKAYGASACAHGRDWPVEFTSVEPEQLVSELRSGMLFKRPLPGFYALAQEFLSKEEMATLLLSQRRDSGLRYFRSPAGHHVLSSLCLAQWT